MSNNKKKIINFFKNKSLLITGGTGSFGQAFVSYLLNNKIDLKKIIVFSRDELKQFEMSKIFNEDKYPNIRYFIGDIRDKDRLKLSLNDVDIVIHAAALKQVMAAEYNPFEFIKTNILGSQNLIDSCLDAGVKNVLALSTDKASSPINLYGATKLCADKLFTAANNIKGRRDIKFSVVRYGNVMGSRGSVLGVFLKEKEKKSFPITDKKMTRFNINMNEAIDFVIYSLLKSKGGEIFVPKIPSFRVIDLANALADNCKLNIIGIRTGEKIHEEMISSNEALNSIDLGKCYAILNEFNYKFYKNYKFLSKDFVYRSDTNKKFLTINNLKKIIRNFLSKNQQY
jgi:UDP-N-acetylglucosamine 4,6-dehydratase (inverting)